DSHGIFFSRWQKFYHVPFFWCVHQRLTMAPLLQKRCDIKPGMARAERNQLSEKYVMAESQMNSEIRELRSSRQPAIMPTLLVKDTITAKVPASSVSAWDASASFGLPMDEHCLKFLPGIWNNCSVSQQI